MAPNRQRKGCWSTVWEMRKKAERGLGQPRPGTWVNSLLQTVITHPHRPRGLDHRHGFPHGSGGCESATKVAAALVSPWAPVLGLWIVPVSAHSLPSCLSGPDLLFLWGQQWAKGPPDRPRFNSVAPLEVQSPKRVPCRGTGGWDSYLWILRGPSLSQNSVLLGALIPAALGMSGNDLSSAVSADFRVADTF